MQANRLESQTTSRVFVIQYFSGRNAHFESDISPKIRVLVQNKR